MLKTKRYNSNSCNETYLFSNIPGIQILDVSLYSSDVTTKYYFTSVFSKSHCVSQLAVSLRHKS